MTVLLMLFLVSCSANEKKKSEIGVKFEDLSFEETLAKAKELNKPVMVDVFSNN